MPQPLNHNLGTIVNDHTSREKSTYFDPSTVSIEHTQLTYITIIEFLLPGTLPMPDSAIIILNYMYMYGSDYDTII